MRRLIIIPLLLASLAFTGCASDKSLFQGGTSVTATVTNPVTNEQLAAVEGTYGVVQTATVNYFRLRQCRRTEAVSATNWCSRRSVKVQLQAASQKAQGTIVALRNFMRDNKQISALSAFTAAKAAVADFQNVAFVNGVK